MRLLIVVLHQPLFCLFAAWAVCLVIASLLDA